MAVARTQKQMAASIGSEQIGLFANVPSGIRRNGTHHEFSRSVVEPAAGAGQPETVVHKVQRKRFSYRIRVQISEGVRISPAKQVLVSKPIVIGGIELIECWRRELVLARDIEWAGANREPLLHPADEG